ncbi:ABC transporter permease [Sphingosinicella rhizophila]|uniref:Oligopeptide transport system permease protein OppC n=1 Tax=Sphingosinicella rhizophila TaxID=3050082 RepID=A0ABU3Q5J1_9SPHN|nr:ABC transporter permease subunit [Sphingosinicella sp. GR2756]MDT9598683.1 ABC transporter permease subunit [Sphingosinicella sp. GR2756]
MRPANSHNASIYQDRGLWGDAIRRFRGNQQALISLAILASLTGLSVLGPLIVPHSYEAIDKHQVWAPPLTDGHLLGTDALGRDLFARIILGLRISLLIGVVATLVSLVIGVGWGSIAGYLGGQVDSIMMRIVDAIYSLPFIFFVIILMTTFQRNFILIFLAIGAVEWLTMARIVRGQAVSLRQREFIEAARAIGMSSAPIIVRHIVPNLLGPVIVYSTLTIPGVILAESFLSFLGLGVQEPLTSLGVLIAQGAQDMEIAWWLLVFPSFVMVATLLSLNLVGDGLRDSLDPRATADA